MRIELTNYRSIARAVLDVPEGQVTCLVGPSDSGKSNVVRAFSDVFLGSRGDGAINAATGHVAQVAVRVGTRTVAWSKGRGKAPKLSVDGCEVPREQVILAGVREVEVAEGVAVVPQLQMQHDPFFLLGGRESATAAALGSLSGLHIASAALCDARRDLDRARKERALADQAHADAKARAEQSRALDVAERDRHAQASRTVSDAREAQDARLQFVRLQGLLRSAAESVAGHGVMGAPDVGRDLARAVALVSAAETMLRRSRALSAAADKIHGAEASEQAARSTYTRTILVVRVPALLGSVERAASLARVARRLVTHRPPVALVTHDGIVRVTAFLSEAEKQLVRGKGLGRASERTRGADRDIEAAQEDMKRADRDLHRAREAGAQVAAGPCPVCGRA